MSPKLRDAGLSALVALGLFAPMIGLLTVSAPGGLFLQTRPLALALAVAAVFFGRLAILSFRGAARTRGDYRANRRLAETLQRSGRFVAPVLLVLAVLLPAFAGRYGLDLGTLILTYVMLGWGLNIVVGLAGLLDLGYVAFYAVGAYTYALLSTQLGLGFWTCLPLAGLLAGLCGVLLGFPVLRLRGDYLAIVTLAFGEIIRVVILNWTSLTGGPNGISGIPRPTLFGLTFGAGGGPGTFTGATGLDYSPTQRVAYLYYVILGLALLTNWVALRLRKVALGRAWEALREDEIACRSLGINVTVTKLTAFAMGATFGGLAGAFFATRAAFISPESFTFIESAIVLAIVVLGGMGSQLGTALAAIVMIGGIELFRDLQDYRMLIFGLALVLMMVLRPRGLVSGRTPSVALGATREIAAELVAEGRG
ncbi:MAG: high-affinity branched-chain amino acid ABC transporter permease LivM [Pseudomonadota bacterium]|nr:high-affinity branched-chain amino acid ABC transporter permease LivM [Pseudomonadota bacterium]